MRLWRNFITEIEKREASGTIFPKAMLIITKDIEVIEIIYDTVVNYSLQKLWKAR